MSIFSEYYIVSTSEDRLATDSEEEKNAFIEYHKNRGSDVAVYWLNEDESVGIE